MIRAFRSCGCSRPGVGREHQGRAKVSDARPLSVKASAASWQVWTWPGGGARNGVPAGPRRSWRAAAKPATWRRVPCVDIWARPDRGGRLVGATGGDSCRKRPKRAATAGGVPGAECLTAHAVWPGVRVGVLCLARGVSTILGCRAASKWTAGRRAAGPRLPTYSSGCARQPSARRVGIPTLPGGHLEAACLFGLGERRERRAEPAQLARGVAGRSRPARHVTVAPDTPSATGAGVRQDKRLGKREAPVRVAVCDTRGR